MPLPEVLKEVSCAATLPFDSTFANLAHDCSLLCVSLVKKHSLTYIYTAISKPMGYPGIHEFTAMGLLDDKIDYHDSENQVKVPKQSWMKERLQQDYWKKGTHGCTALLGNVQDDGSIKFNRGMDMYNYDGRDFLLFDDGNGVWVASVEPVVTTKRKWDGVLVLKEYTKGYLENECIKWLTEFLDYGGGGEHSHGSKPEVFLYTTKSKVKSNVVLNCLPTSFYPKDIIVQIKQNDHVLSKLDGLETSDVRPNEDDTFQRRDHVKILKSDVSTYSCEPHVNETNVNVFCVSPPPDEAGGSNTAIIIGAVIAALVLVGVLVLVVSKITGKIGRWTMLYNL
uniref:Major histocompatibility complex class I ZAA n=1 Tax=Acanthochromis polyacanthus TaxID=80966 RepID=A0A3Q1F4E5_9TELE